ncbi:MAG TPA: hypothetical protein VMU49_06565 [Candidatus Acidoferrales bacterium]|nr:hypothetical protein [Candidatus Acidoferrales bacterium]
MSEETYLRLGVSIWSSDGKHVGDLEAMIAQQEGFQPEALIVQESKWFTGHVLTPGSSLLVDEVVVRMSEVGKVTRDRIDLLITADQVRRLPPYLKYHYRPLSRGEALMQVVAVGSSGITIPGLEQTADKAADAIEIGRGENLMAPGGKKLGQVKEVLLEGDVLIGVVLQPGGFFKHEVIFPRRLLQRGDDLALFTNLSPEDLASLEPFLPVAEG